MASVFEKRPGQWVAKYKDIHGKWKQKALPARNRSEARRMLVDLELETQATRGAIKTGGDGTTWTVTQLMEWCLKTYWHKSSDKITTFVVRHFVNDGDEITTTMLVDLTAGKIERFLQRKSENLVPASVNHLRGYLHAAINHAKAAGLFTGTNPASAVKKRKVPKRIPDYLRDHEVQPVLAMISPQWRNFFAVAFWTGLRKGELAALRKCDIDLDAREMIVRGSWNRNQTKGGHHDVLPIAPALVPVLKQAIESSPSEFVFPRKDGTMLPEDVDLIGIFQSALRRAGIVTGYEHVCRRQGCGHKEHAHDDRVRHCPSCKMKLWPRGIVRRIRFHDMRHTTATLLLKAGVPLATVQKILRHSDPRLTALTYGHLDIDDMRAGMERLEENLKLAYDRPKRSFGANLVPGTFFDLGAGERVIEKDSDFEGVEASGQQDSNLRPSGPKGESGALIKIAVVRNPS